jgi:2-methylisocitrate lyase-like PEP mutase family enzyme
MPSTHIAALRALLEREKGLLVPGAPNALAARIIADLGFKAVYRAKPTWRSKAF